MARWTKAAGATNVIISGSFQIPSSLLANVLARAMIDALRLCCMGGAVKGDVWNAHVCAEFLSFLEVF
jgi:hypothetical protein